MISQGQAVVAGLAHAISPDVSCGHHARCSLGGTPRCHRGCDRLPPPIELARANPPAHKVSRKTWFFTVRMKRIPTDCENGFTISPKPARAVLGVSRRSLGKTGLFSRRNQNHGGQAGSQRQRHEFCGPSKDHESFRDVDRRIFQQAARTAGRTCWRGGAHSLGRVSFVSEPCSGVTRPHAGVISFGH